MVICARLRLLWPAPNKAKRFSGFHPRALACSYTIGGVAIPGSTARACISRIRGPPSNIDCRGWADVSLGLNFTFVPILFSMP